MNANNKKAEHWRSQAAELREAAKSVHNPDAKATLLKIAETYEQLAVRIESQAEPEAE